MPLAIRIAFVVLFAPLAASPSGAEARAAGPPLELLRPLTREARAVVALSATRVTPVDATETPTRMQDYEVEGTVAECFKGELRRAAQVRYRLTAEAPPQRLAHDHVAFLKRTRVGWVAVEGPMFEDGVGLRRALRQTGASCR